VPRTGQPAIRLVGSVQRAFALVDVLADADGELGTNEIARRAGLNASSVSRLLATLVAGGLVEHVQETGRYRLGHRLVELGNVVLARLDLRQIARPHLHALVESTGETATLSAQGERDAVTVDFVQSPASVQGVAQLGRPSISHATATGKVLLAFGRRALPPGPLKAYTSAPIWGSNGELAAIIGVQGPATRFDGDAMEAAVEPLLAHARDVSLELGWTGLVRERVR